jgi:uncharacterized membrane protein
MVKEIAMARFAGTVTIANGQTTSGAFDCGNTTLAAIQLPSDFTGTSVTFQGSIDGTTYTTIYDDTNTVYSIPVAVSRGYGLELALFYPWRYIKIVSASSEGAARSIVVSTTDL